MLDSREIVSKEEVYKWNEETQESELWGYIVQLVKAPAKPGYYVGGYGLMDLEENILTEHTYERIDQDQICLERYFKVRNKDKKWGVLDLNGKEILPCIYEEIAPDGIFFKVYMDLLPGSNERRLPAQGIADDKGNILISPHYDDIHSIFNVPSAVIENTKTSNKDTRFLNRFIITHYIEKGPGCYSYEWPQQQALIDEKEHFILPYCDSIISTADGCFFCVHNEGNRQKLSFFDIDGNKLNDSITVDAIEYCHGSDRYRITSSKKKGIISNTGEIIAKCTYDTIQRAGRYTTIVWASTKGQFVLLDVLTGQRNEVPNIKEVGDFYRHCAICRDSSNRVGVVDDQGKSMIPFEYDESGARIKDGVIMKKKDRFGVVSYDNEVILPFIYDEIDGLIDFPSGSDEEYYESAIVRKQDLFGLVWTSGKTIIEPIYDEIIDTIELQADEALYKLLGGRRKGHVYLAKKSGKYICIEIDSESGILKGVSPVALECDIYEYIDDYYR